ncbi:MAG: DegT/DnrJ/EryC1/StrS family aminotransferase [Isosphaeraceae bacterium]
MSRIFLSPPHLGDEERTLLLEALQSNWVAPLGPHVDAFEREFAGVVNVPYALAVSSGTAALHLAMRVLGVGPGDTVLCPTLTFIASAAPALYQGATPAFIDVDDATWNLDPGLLADELAERARRGRLPRAVVVVDLYGQTADYDSILEVCERYEIPVVADSAESLGASYRGRPAGSFGRLAAFSFNGNKIITTSGGGMLVSHDLALIEKARWLASQAREPTPHYEHRAVGYNYRMSNLLAAVGRAQLAKLGQRVDARRRVNAFYRNALGGLSGLTFMPRAAYGEPNDWLTCVLIDPERFGATREDVRRALGPRTSNPALCGSPCIFNRPSPGVRRAGRRRPVAVRARAVPAERVGHD